MATLEQLQSKISKLQQQAEALVASKTQAALEKIRELMDAHGLTTADIAASKGVSAKKEKPAAAGQPAAEYKGKLPPKYMNPKTGETWSGHARPPAWIKNVKDRTKFLIAGAAAATSATSNNFVSKVKQDVKRAVPPKYRDPKTGATWTGRGLPPKWIASAKNRDRFLIDAVVEPAADATPKRAAAVKSRTAKKVVSTKTSKPAAAKKAPARKVVKAKKPAAREAAPVNVPESVQPDVAKQEVLETAEA